MGDLGDAWDAINQRWAKVDHQGRFENHSEIIMEKRIQKYEEAIEYAQKVFRQLGYAKHAYFMKKVLEENK